MHRTHMDPLPFLYNIAIDPLSNPFLNRPWLQRGQIIGPMSFSRKTLNIHNTAMRAIHGIADSAETGVQICPSKRKTTPKNQTWKEATPSNDDANQKNTHKHIQATQTKYHHCAQNCSFTALVYIYIYIYAFTHAKGPAMHIHEQILTNLHALIRIMSKRHCVSTTACHAGRNANSLSNTHSTACVPTLASALYTPR